MTMPRNLGVKISRRFCVEPTTVRCGLHAALTNAGQNVLEGIWAIWSRLGISDNLQVDNTMSFFGRPRHPRGMGHFMCLCVYQGVEPLFIPMPEPWRNGMVEQFNDHCQKKFLGKVTWPRSTNCVLEPWLSSSGITGDMATANLAVKRPSRLWLRPRCI